jgi:hypothetical protein
LFAELLSSKQGIANRILSKHSCYLLFSKQNGTDNSLGNLYLIIGFKIFGNTLKDQKIFFKSIQNGHSTYVISYVNKGCGVVILMNSDNGDELAWEIIRSVSNQLSWPKDDTKVIQKEIKKINNIEKRQYIGEFKNFEQNKIVKISKDNENLIFEISGKSNNIYSESEKNYYFTENGFILNFINDELIINYPNNGESYLFKKL